MNEQDKNVSHADWDNLERVIDRFEHAWQQGQWPVLEHYLPPPGPDRRAALIELVHTDLECRLKAGARVRVEGYLARFPDLAQDRSVVLDLIAAEFDLRSRREPELSAEEFCRRFPLHADALVSRLRSSSQALEEPGRPFLRGSQFRNEPPAPSIDSVDALVEVLDAYRLLQPGERQDLAQLLGGVSEPQALAREMVQRGWLTPLQVNRLFQGRGRELVLGPYYLLERLGSGGMGQVYKARSLDLDRMVAVKLLRKDLV